MIPWLFIILLLTGLVIFRDCRPIIETRHKSADLETNTRIMLDAIMLPVVIIDPDLQVEEYNLAFADWCREIGITTDLRNNSIKIISRLLKTLRPAQLNQVLETNRPAIYEEMIEMGKQTLMFEIRFVPLGEKGKTRHILITIRDNTAEQRLKNAGICTGYRKQAAHRERGRALLRYPRLPDRNPVIIIIGGPDC